RPGALSCHLLGDELGGLLVFRGLAHGRILPPERRNARASRADDEGVSIERLAPLQIRHERDEVDEKALDGVKVGTLGEHELDLGDDERLDEHEAGVDHNATQGSGTTGGGVSHWRQTRARLGSPSAVARAPIAAYASRVASTSARHGEDRKSTRLNSSHVKISYAVFCLKKKIHDQGITTRHIKPV